MLQNTTMKVLKSEKLNAFGGLNFVHDQLQEIGIDIILEDHLPVLAPQSQYCWNDIFSSLLSIYYCGGNRIEDAKLILKNHFSSNPFFKLCSPDTILKRLKSLQVSNISCRTPRGKVDHDYNHNAQMCKLNIEILKSLGVFAKHEVVLDYDNTIIFTEKSDSKMSYKRAPGYQPGVCLVNEKDVLYVENRNGNSDAKSFQNETLQRMFDVLSQQNVAAKYIFRADSASHQFKVFETLEQNKCTFYIGAKNSYVEKRFSTVEKWIKVQECGQEKWVGETTYTPFLDRYKDGEEPKTYRLLVKRTLNKTGQVNIITNDSYSYRAIITNDDKKDLKLAVDFYNQRGAAEKQFDILKNDFGWSSLPFSHLAENCVFMYFTAICRNIYNTIIYTFAKHYKNVRVTDRMKRFVFTFITIPAKWVNRSRTWYLRIFGEIHLRV
jgi:Transposase DDE domain.